MGHAVSQSITAPGSRWAAAIVLVAWWIIALPLDVATTRHLGGDQTFTGVGILFLGPLGVLGAVIGWYANPLLLLALIVALSPVRRRRVMIVLASLIALLAISSLWWNCVPDDSGTNPIIAWHVGYWSWMATMLVAAMWLVTLGVVDDRRAATPHRWSPPAAQGER